ncbi:PREDICTED: transmembrane protein 53 [Nanorana parkeri]|uniref:transmembrane protein 53 n=1 Tax=Nanorana parkeri TaxID=125878 RepID=UPI00085453B2|nr:PREDICTED: transmembrane protein 53 [Nanorana parkeri]
MGETDFDYSIFLPEPGLPGSRWDQQREPVVILLGWAGCKEQHLDKYSNFYRKQGCIVLSHTAAWRTVFFAESFGLRYLREEAKKLLGILYDYEIEVNPVMFHVFSNGGFMLYRYMTELLHSDPKMRQLHVVGTTFDSAPGNRNVYGSVQALNAILRPGTAWPLRFPLLAAFAIMVFLLRIVLYPLTRFLHENHYDAMKRDPSLWPQLYLYSRADRIVSHKDVEGMVTARRQRHLPTESLDFQKSEHVSHYRRYPEKYSHTCVAFLADCVNRAAKSSFMSGNPSF